MKPETLQQYRYFATSPNTHFSSIVVNQLLDEIWRLRAEVNEVLEESKKEETGT